MRTKSRRSRAGISLVEVLVATMLVGVVLIGAMNCVGAVVRGRLGTGDSGKAQQLASQLMAEILENDYLEPTDVPEFGRESGESGGQRTDWDDVDDYDSWSASPPEDRAGTPLPNSEGWRRDVLVEWVDPGNPANTVGSDQGVKRVTVTVQHNGKFLDHEVALRSDKYTGAVP